MKRQTTFQFERVPLKLERYLIEWTRRVGLDDRDIARMTRCKGYDTWSNKIQAIKYVREKTILGLKESKDYVEACMAAYPEERPRAQS